MERIVVGEQAAPIDADLEELNRRLAAQSSRRRRVELGRGLLRIVACGAIQFYWLVCGAVILIGLDAAYPAAGQRLAYAFADPSLALDRPFASCTQAHANGYYAIPRRSRAYAAGQDGDGDGRACEPPPGRLPDLIWRLRIIQDRLFAPW